MADLNARIKPKKSSTAGEVPQAADLEVSEIAVNTADGKLFVKHADNSIKEISGGGAVTRTALGIGEYADDTAAGSGGVASGALYYNTTSSDYRLKT
jgi:hypothetical protein